MKPMPWIRFLAAVALLSAAGLFLHARSRPEDVPSHRPVEDFPVQIGDWTGIDVPIPSDVREILGNGDFLERFYQSPTRGTVDLFLAYFPSQRTGDTIHSPQNCLPGTGWTPVSADHVTVHGPRGEAIRANRYLIARGDERQLVVYWFQAHGHTEASEYEAKIRLVTDAIRMNRTDGALVRMTTPVTTDTAQAAQQRLLDFARQIIPLLDAYIPR
jgi:EpsI family protein